MLFLYITINFTLFMCTIIYFVKLFDAFNIFFKFIFIKLIYYTLQFI